jgi:hypothetical protein
MIRRRRGAQSSREGWRSRLLREEPVAGEAGEEPVAGEAGEEPVAAEKAGAALVGVAGAAAAAPAGAGSRSVARAAAVEGSRLL